MKRQNSQGATRSFIKICPIVFLLVFIGYFEWQSWRANSRRQIILNTPRESICETNDVICKQCPFFREKVIRMNGCVRDLLDERIGSEDVGYVYNSIQYAVVKCNVKWTMTQRIIQMIKNHDTQFVLVPANFRDTLTALVIGADENFYMEKQLAENMTKVSFYGTNFEDTQTVERFEKRLNGTLIENNIDVLALDSKKRRKGNLYTSLSNDSFCCLGQNLNLSPRKFFQTYFPRRPLDILFLHSNNISYELVDQLMGRGFNGVQHPVCQLNVELLLPSNLSDARQIVQWFRQLNTNTKLQQQYLIGYATIVIKKSEMRLRLYAINVGQTKCVAKFLRQSECHALIGTIYDE